MATDVPVIFPRRPDRGHRDMLWEFVRGKWEEHGYAPLIESDSEGEWSRGEAINRAVAQTAAEVFIVADADVVFADWEQPRQAAALALGTGSLVYAHRRHHMLPLDATNLVLAGHAPDPDGAEQAVDNTMSSCWAISREGWETIGGFDERFVEWGAEDWMWFAACETLLGIERVEAYSFHLWHPRESEADHPHYAHNIELGKRYMAAKGNHDVMEALLSEPGGPLEARRKYAEFEDWYLEGIEPESNAGKWNGWHGEQPKPFGDTPSYEKGANWLRSCAGVEDWGCGGGWLSTFFTADHDQPLYRGVDGSETPFASEIVDLTQYRSQTEGIFIRHVLEHNYEWTKILDNALASFTKRMVLVLFTPLAEETHDTEFEDPPGVPNLAFRLEDLTEHIAAAGATFRVEELGNAIPYGLREPKQVGTETIFYLSR